MSGSVQQVQESIEVWSQVPTVSPWDNLSMAADIADYLVYNINSNI
jgi:hypothetical protein